MTPNELADYFRVCKEANIMSIALSFDNIQISATFGPEVPLMPNFNNPSPGGWKGPKTLDDGRLFNPDNEPSV